MPSLPSLPSLPYTLDRTVVIQATPDTVFGFLTDTPRWAAWWGAGSEIDARPGGQMKICYPGGTEAVGEVIEVTPPERIVFTYGYASGKMIPPGGSRVTIQLEWDPEGLTEKVGSAVGVDDRQVKADAKRFKEFIEKQGGETGSWRGDVPRPGA